MKHRNAIGIGLALLCVATAAQAQVAVEPSRGATIVPPTQLGLANAEVLAIVRASGLTPLTQPARQGAHYVVLASDNMGGQLRVVVGANRRILHAAPAHDPRFAYQPVRPRGYIPVVPQHDVVSAPSRGVAPPPDLREPSAPLPRVARAPRAPADVPQDSRLASVPEVTGSVPTRTPLPRPRPTIAANDVSPPATPSEPEAPAATAAAPAATAEQPTARPPAAAPKAASAQPTEMVPVAPLD